MTKKRVTTKRKTKPATKVDPVLAGYAEKVNTLGRKMISDVIEIGRILALARKRAGHGHWLEWLKTVGLTDDTARNFMRVSKFMCSPKSRNFRRTKAPLTVLYAITRENVSNATRELVLGRIASGEKIPATITTRELVLGHTASVTTSKTEPLIKSTVSHLTSSEPVSLIKSSRFDSNFDVQRAKREYVWGPDPTETTTITQDGPSLTEETGPTQSITQDGPSVTDVTGPTQSITRTSYHDLINAWLRANDEERDKFLMYIGGARA